MRHLFALALSLPAYRHYWAHIKGNKTAWILSAMAAKYKAETGKDAIFEIDKERRRLFGAGDSFAELDAEDMAKAAPPVVEPPAAAPPKAPVRHALWLPTSEEIEAGFYIVKPETFATMDGGAWHFVQVEPGPAYPFSDGWTGQRIKWKPAETAGPFVPDAGVLEAALAADAARVAAILARR